MTRTTLRTDTYGALLARRVRASGEAGHALGIELKPSYWATGCQYLRELEAEMEAPSLFDAEALG